MNKSVLTVIVGCSLCILIQAFAATGYIVYDEESNDFGAAKEEPIAYNDEELKDVDLNQENAADINDNQEVKGEGNFDDEVDGEYIDDEDYNEEQMEDDPDRLLCLCCCSCCRCVFFMLQTWFVYT